MNITINDVSNLGLETCIVNILDVLSAADCLIDITFINVKRKSTLISLPGQWYYVDYQCVAIIAAPVVTTHAWVAPKMPLY